MAFSQIQGMRTENLKDRSESFSTGSEELNYCKMESSTSAKLQVNKSFWGGVRASHPHIVDVHAISKLDEDLIPDIAIKTSHIYLHYRKELSKEVEDGKESEEME